MPIGAIHENLANTAALYIGALAIWGLWRYLRKQGVDSSYFGALVIAEVLFVLQGALGTYIWASGLGAPARGWFHVLYGMVCVLVAPGIYLFTKGDDQRRTMLIYALGCIFLVGIVFRSMATGG